MARRQEGMLKHRVIGGLCGLAVGGSAGAFSYAQTAMGASPVLGVPVALLLAIVGTVGGVIVGAWTAPKPEAPEARPLDRLRADPSWATEQRRYVREAIEQQLAHTIAMVAVHPAAAQGVVYFPDGEGILRPRFVHNPRRPLQEIPWFREFQGCTGDAWGHGRQKVADLTEATTEVLRHEWKMYDWQIDLTRGLKVVVSTPIWAVDDPQRRLGVVSIDSTTPAAESGLTSKHALEASTKCAALVAQIVALSRLEVADLVYD